MPYALPSHSQRLTKQQDAAYDHARGTAAERGYDARWRKFRAWFLKRHPVCEADKTEPATTVHHTRGLKAHPEDRCNESRCMALCHSCHSRMGGRPE